MSYISGEKYFFPEFETPGQSNFKGLPRGVDMPTLSWNFQLHNDGSQRSDGVRSSPLDMFYSKVYAFDVFRRFFFVKKIRFFCC